MRPAHLLFRVVLCAIACSTAFAYSPAAFADDDAADHQTPGSITFVGKNMVATAHGTFHTWRFTQAEFDPDSPAGGVVEIEVDIASIDTKIEKRDDHLRTADFFDVENYPTATLRIYDIALAGSGDGANPAYTDKLDWTMHGVEKTYDNFTFELTGRNPTRVVGQFTINRMDFNIGEPHKTLSPMSIKEEIPITFEAVVPETL